MRKNKFTTKQQLAILAEHDASASIADLCRKHQVSAATLYNWKKNKVPSPLHLRRVTQGYDGF